MIINKYERGIIMRNINLSQMVQNGDFPLVEALFSESSNVNGDTVVAHAITKVNEVDEVTRLDYLVRLLPIVNSMKPVVVSGFSFAKTENWTVADECISKYKEFENKQFQVIWLDNEYLESEYHGNAGYCLQRLRGIVVHYPNEMSNVA